MISIIVPIYNSEKTLKRCIDSIINQSINEFEVLLIDDGSTDSSKKICEVYQKDSRVKLFSKENNGVSSARNLGINKATGDWILFVDSDDFLEPDTLYQYEKVISTENTYYIQDYYIDMSSLQWKVEFAKNNKLVSFYETMNVLMTRYHNSIGYIWHCLFNKKLIDKYNIRFNEDLTFGEDAVFAFQYLQYIDSGIFIPYKGYHYCNINPVSLTKTAKLSPLQCYKLIESIFISVTPKLKNSKGKSDIIQNYVVNLLIRNIVFLRTLDFIEKRKFYTKYRELVLSYITFFSDAQYYNVLLRIANEPYSIGLESDIITCFNKNNVQKRVYLQRVIDKLYNIFR